MFRLKVLFEVLLDDLLLFLHLLELSSRQLVYELTEVNIICSSSITSTIPFMLPSLNH